MISEQQQEQASLYVLGALTDAERQSFEADVRALPELRQLVNRLENTAILLAKSVPMVEPPSGMRDRVLGSVGALPSTAAAIPPTRTLTGPSVDPAFFFVAATDTSGWKQLPVPGASLKILSADRERGYAVLLGRIEAGVRYPAHSHDSPEDILVLTGDLTIAGRRLGPGDFHHCAAGTEHPVNFSDGGCTLLAVLAYDNELVTFAMG